MIAKLKSFEITKDSGVGWLGEMPKHWKLVPGRACFRQKMVANGYLRETTVLSLSYGKIVVKPPETLHGLVPSSFETYQIIEPLDIVVRPTDLQNDYRSLRFGISGHRGIITSAYLCLVVANGVTSQYGHLLLHSYDLKKVFYGLGSGLRQNLDWNDFKYLPCLVPPLSEQAAIVRFVNYADRRIRRYIRTKQKLVELLLEQKQATIHQAVTGQIDARTGQRYSAYKSSGVEWLGKVPEHWEISRVKNEFHCLNRHRLPLNSPERGLMTGRQYDYYGASGVIDKVDDYLFDDELLLLAEDGANLVLRNLPLAIIARGKFWVNNHAHILKPKRGHLEFLSGVMEGLNYLPWISGAAQPKLTKDRLMSIAIAVPTLEEQQSFVTSVTDATYHLRRAIFLERRQIELLREYRTRLISDAVTGKIDVREATVGAKGDPNE